MLSRTALDILWETPMPPLRDLESPVMPVKSHHPTESAPPRTTKTHSDGCS